MDNKRKITIVLLICFLVTIGGIAQGKTLDLWINNSTVTAAVAPMIDQGTIYVPLRSTAEAMGAYVYYDRQLGEAILFYKGDFMRMKNDSTVVRCNGEAVALSAAPKNVQGTIMVPIWFITQLMHCDVVWDQQWNQLYINDGDNEMKISVRSKRS